jgi:hypothetical protein
LNIIGIDLIGIPYFETYSYLVETLYFERRVQELNLLEEEKYMEISSKLEENNIAQKAYLVYHRKIRVSILEHPSLQYLFPFLRDTIIVCLNECIDLKIKKQILELRIDLWNSLQSADVRFDLLIVLIRRFGKVLQQQNSKLFDPLLCTFKSLSESLSLNKYNQSSVLWRRTCVATFTKESLWQLGNELECLDKKIDIWRHSPRGW